MKRLIEDLLALNENGWNSFERWTYKDDTNVWVYLDEQDDGIWSQSFEFVHDDWEFVYNTENKECDELNAEMYTKGDVFDIEHWLIYITGTGEVPEGD